jgi:hypothetical protein
MAHGSHWDVICNVSAGLRRAERLDQFLPGDLPAGIALCPVNGCPAGFVIHQVPDLPDASAGEQSELMATRRWRVSVQPPLLVDPQLPIPGFHVARLKLGEHTECAYRPCQHIPRCRHGYALCLSAYFGAPVWLWQPLSAYHVGAPGRFSVRRGRATFGIRSRVIFLHRHPIPGG